MGAAICVTTVIKPSEKDEVGNNKKWSMWINIDRPVEIGLILDVVGKNSLNTCTTREEQL